MSKKGIDLLSGQALKVARTNRVIRWQKRTVWGLLGVFVLLLMVVYGWWGLETRRKVAVGEERRNLAQQLKNRSQLQGQFILTKEILFRADQILKVRKDFQRVLSDAYELFPYGSMVKGVTFSDKGVRFEVSNDGVQQYARFVDRLRNVGDNHQRFKSARLVSSNRGSDGVWTASLEIILRKEL